VKLTLFVNLLKPPSILSWFRWRWVCWSLSSFSRASPNRPVLFLKQTHNSYISYERKFFEVGCFCRPRRDPRSARHNCDGGGEAGLAKCTTQLRRTTEASNFKKFSLIADITCYVSALKKERVYLPVRNYREKTSKPTLISACERQILAHGKSHFPSSRTTEASNFKLFSLIAGITVMCLL
jgi:hypothetical protein